MGLSGRSSANDVMVGPRDRGGAAIMDRLRLLSNVFKLRIGVAITLCALAGMAITPGKALSASEIAILTLAVLLSSASAGAFNQYAERELDARMRRTAGRPFVTGVFKAGWPWLVCIGAILAVAVGGAAWLLNPHVALYVFLGAFVYGVVYTVWLKQRSAWNIVVGGLAGSFAVLAGAAAVTPALAPASIILAIVLFLWTPPHFWSLAMILHKDYAEAGVPMLPVVVGDAAAAKIILLHTIAVTALSLLPVFFGMGLIYLAGALIGGGIFLKRSAELARDPSRANASRNFQASLLQLGLLLTAAILDRALLA
jgi:protoheme IX farnesyltransferase